MPTRTPRPARPRKPKATPPPPPPAPVPPPPPNGASRPKPSTVGGASTLPVLASQVVRRQHEWIWDRYLPRDEMTLVVGDTGAGKSTYLSYVAACLSAGREHCGRRGQAPAHVLWYGAEEDPAATITPRLVAAGAEVHRVYLGDTAISGRPLPRLRLPADLGRLGQRIGDLGVSLLVLDPITSYIAGIDGVRDDQQVRELLDALVQECTSRRCTPICTKHYRKGREGDPLSWVGGCGAWVQVPRVVLACGYDPDDRAKRILAVAKSSLGPIPPSVEYQLQPHGDSCRWVGGRTRDLTADDLGEGVMQPGERDALTDAVAYLLAELEADEQPASALCRRASEAGISVATLRRAKAKLGIVSARVGMGPGGVWVWRIPPQEGPPAGP